MTPTVAPAPSLLEVSDLSVRFLVRDKPPVYAVRSLSYRLDAGKTLAIVGESGSGKTTACRALMGLLPSSAIVLGGIRIDGSDYADAQEPVWRSIRGRLVSMVFQDPTRSLNPTMRVGAQIVEAIRLHRRVDVSEARREAVSIMDMLRIPSAASRFHQYPHELSGGMRQRVAIGMAMAARPKLLIADECTRSLDPLTEANTLRLFRDIQKELGTAIILIGHNLRTLAGVADDMLVMYGGEAVECGSATAIMNRPKMPYTRALRDAACDYEGIMDGEFRRRTSDQLPTGPSCVVSTAAAPILSVKQVAYSYSPRVPGRVSAQASPALSNLTFDIGEAEIVGVLGENGAGKSTLARAIMRIAGPDAGAVLFQGVDLVKLRGRALHCQRRHMQLVMQDPIGSLNPRWRVSELVEEPLRGFKLGDKVSRARKVAEVLDRVGLPESQYGQRRPRELSGGQCQRVAIARALTVDPKLLILDEAVSTLDALIQAQIIDLLLHLRADLRVSILFISHDLRLARRVSDRIAILHRGQLCEIGAAHAIYANPAHPHSKALIDTMKVHRKPEEEPDIPETVLARQARG